MSLFNFYEFTFRQFCRIVIKKLARESASSATVNRRCQPPEASSGIILHLVVAPFPSLQFPSFTIQFSIPNHPYPYPNSRIQGKEKGQEERRFNPDLCLANPFFRCFKCESSRNPLKRSR